MSEETDTKKQDDQKDQQQKSDGRNIAVLNDSVRIDLSRLLPEYSNNHVKAYYAEPADSIQAQYFAVLCNPAYTPRSNLSNTYQEIAHPNLVRLVTHGLLKMPSGDGNAYAFVYENRLGKRLYDDMNNIALGWKPERVLDKIVMPIFDALKDLNQKGVVHSNIRLNNLYDGGKENFESVILGDCLSTPASMAQPVVFETIERSMADPIGRGDGTIEDDLYALGVIIAMFLRSYDPLKNKTDTEILAAKVVGGSYNALVGGNDRFSGGILELLRGLLLDDSKQRWTIEDILAWADGKRLSPKQPIKRKKASRAIHLDGVSYYYATTFAHNMVKRPQEAVALIDNHELLHWCERSMNDEELSHRVERAIQSAQEGGLGAGYWDRLLSRVSVALDLEAPIRYKHLSFLPEGLGDLMGEYFVQNKDTRVFIDLINSGLLGYWVSACAESSMDVTTYMVQFDKCRNYLRQENLINGIERCLYDLNPSIHCLSPLIKNFFVHNVNEYILALEGVAGQYSDNNYPDHILDKHAACFIAVRDARMIEPYIFDLASKEYFRYVLGNLQALAAIQRTYKIDPCPNLMSWFISLLPVVINRYHNRDTREELKKRMNKVRGSGDLTALLDIVENPQEIRDDQLGFRQALKKYQLFVGETRNLVHQLENPKYFAMRKGQEWAATISGVVSALIVLGFLLVHFSSGTGSGF